MIDDYIDADYERSFRYHSELANEVRDVLRPRFPYIDEATDLEVIQFAESLFDDEASD